MLLLLPAASTAVAAPARLELAPVAREARLAEDLRAPRRSPLRYAEVREVSITMLRGVASAGTWSDARDAQGAAVRRWTLTVSTPGALSQDFGFAHLFLPHGASLVLRDSLGRVAAGPYTDAEVTAGRRFQTAVTIGDRTAIEIDVPPSLQRHLSFELDRVAPAHRNVFAPSEGGFAKSGSCNVDVRCPQGAPYPDQINSVARYLFSGFLCTGALVNNTAGDRTPYLLTAQHCVDTQAEASSMVLYWKYENPTCRTPGSGASGTPIPLGGNSIAQTGGADLRATKVDSDFTLVQLRSAPPAAANAFFAGWDRRNVAPPSAFTIHHPQGHEKRISFDNEPLQIFDQPISFNDGNSFLRVIDYELGTTEGGSSGGPLFNPERRIVGQLTGGAALCSVPQGDDYFGRMFTSFIRGTTPATRLREWLDPTDTGVQTLDGISATSGGCASAGATLSAPAVTRAGEPVDLVVTLPAGSYTIQWDVDADGVIDRTQTGVSGTQTLQPVYPREANQPVVVRVTDSTGCVSTLQRSLVIDGPRIFATVGSAPQQLCGDFDANVEPGERWRIAVNIRNDGAKALTGGHAVFAPGDATNLRLETPALPISLGPNGITAGGQVDFAIPTNAVCGSVANIRYIGALDRTAWSMEQSTTLFGVTLGGGGGAGCSIVQSCPAQITPIAAQVGLFNNPNRFGNGIGTAITQNSGNQPPVLFGAWFTGTLARIPTWYTIQAPLIDNRADVAIRQFRRTSQNPFAFTGSIVGSGQVTYIGPNDYLFTFDLGGQTGGERHVLAVPDTTVVPDRTGIWHNPPEAGSGYFIDNHRNAGIPSEILIAFVYGTDNEPRWTFGSRALSAPTAIEDYFEIHCPTCPTLVDFGVTRVQAGTATPNYTSRTTGTLSIDLRATQPFSLDWVRSGLPIELISTPRP